MIILALLALGARLAVRDSIPERPRWLYQGMTRRRRGVNVEYPPGVARLAGIALILYAAGIGLVTANLASVLAGGNPPAWTGLGGWPLLLGILVSIYVMLRLRRRQD